VWPFLEGVSRIMSIAVLVGRWSIHGACGESTRREGSTPNTLVAQSEGGKGRERRGP
jgi:hypothetical protein